MTLIHKLASIPPGVLIGMNYSQFEIDDLVEGTQRTGESMEPASRPLNMTPVLTVWGERGIKGISAGSARESKVPQVGIVPEGRDNVGVQDAPRMMDENESDLNEQQFSYASLIHPLHSNATAKSS